MMSPLGKKNKNYLMDVTIHWVWCFLHNNLEVRDSKRAFHRFKGGAPPPSPLA